jgi:hypothetical protein
MALNYIILGLVFLAGLVLILGSVFNAKFLLGNNEQGHETEGHSIKPAGRGIMTFFLQIFNGIAKIPLFSDKKRSAYFFIGIVIIVLGIVAIFTGFLNEKIKFE